MLERVISKVNSLIAINMGVANMHTKLKRGDARAGETYWEEQSRKIHEAYFGNTDNFFKEPVVQLHIASPDLRLGKFIVKALKKTEVGIEFLGKISDSPLGGPIRIPQFQSISPTTATHIANLVHIEEVLGLNLRVPRKIIEFGGGYGGLARCLKLTHSAHEITIVDSPLMTDIQFDFLRNTTPINQNFDVCFREKITSLDGEFDIFNASFSLSETPFDTREEVLDFLRARCKNFLIIFQKSFLHYDNESYFYDWISKLSDTHSCKIEKYPWYRGRDDAYAFSGKRIAR